MGPVGAGRAPDGEDGGEGVKDLARLGLATVLAPVRRRQPYVIWGNEPMNGGNYLFLWATAWARHQSSGVRWQVRYKPKMEPWLQEFPALRALTVREEDVSFLQPRTVEWGQNVQRDFLYPELKRFCREFLLQGSRFPQRWDTVTPDATVINVRRGDYYSNPAFRQNYGFDVKKYVAEALKQLEPTPGAPTVLVSDDPDWTLQNLQDLVADSPVSVMRQPHDMFQDLAQLVMAKNLVLANSTFSYWGGYLASSLPPERRPRRIVAPLFFGRHYPYGESDLLLPEWLAIPGDLYGEGKANHER